MDIKSRTVLIMGGYKPVGRAVARELFTGCPARVVPPPLYREEAQETARRLFCFFEEAQPTAEWGNVFAPTKHKDHSCSELSAGGTARKELAGWIFSAEEHDTRPQVREQEVL